MSKTIKALVVLAALATVAACAQQSDDVEEFVIVDPAPTLSEEPVFTGKYN